MNKSVRQRGGVQPTKTQLSDIVDAALAIVGRAGLEHLTIKAVAESMGLTSPALYYYLPGGRDELVAMAATQVIDTAFPGSFDVHPEDDWFEVLLSVLCGVGVFSQRYPGIIPYLLTTGRELPANVHTTDFVVAQLRTGGFSTEAAGLAYGAIYSYVTGWAAATPVSSGAAAAAGLTGLSEVLTRFEESSASRLLKVGLSALIRGLHQSLVSGRDANQSGR